MIPRETKEYKCRTCTCNNRTHACYIQTGLWKCCAVWSKRAFNSETSNGGAARLVTRQRRCDHQHITSSLTALHWLPVRWRINYKILLLTHHALHDVALAFIVNVVSPYTPGRRLHSTDNYLLTVPRHDMERSGRRGFTVTAPRLWNGLVDGVSP